MSYFLIEDFKAGLDVRKSILTAPAGSLTRLVNAAISPGGEIVKRRAFVKVADLKGTFGLAAIGPTVVAFTRNVVTPNPGLKDPATGIKPEDVTLEYHRLPNTSPSARLADFDVLDGKLYVTLYDPSPTPPANTEQGATLPAGVPDGTTYALPDGSVKVWKQTNWRDWAPTKQVGQLPARGGRGDTFRNLTEDKIYTVNYNSEWELFKPRDTIENLPGDTTGYSTGDVIFVTKTQTYYVAKATKAWSAWYPDASGAFLPSNQMEGYTVYNYNDKVRYVTKAQKWELWFADHTVTALPKTYADGTAFYNTATKNYYEWKTSGWILWQGGAPNPTASGTLAGRPVTGSTGDVYKATDTGDIYEWQSTQWVKWTLTPRLVNPHYYFDDREKVNDELVQNLDLTWTWTTKANPDINSYVETEGSGMGLFVRAYKSKMYAVGDKYLRFSATENAHLWQPATDPNDTSRTGAGYINVSLQEGSSAVLKGVEIYYDKLALMSEYTTQIWSVTSDPKQAAMGQVLRGTGTRAPWSVQQYGSGDILFLASSGIRSLKARDLSNSAAVSDIGSPIDDYVRALPDKYAASPATQVSPTIMMPGVRMIEPMATAPKADFYNNARAILEPIVGRFWLCFPREIMVLSAFPGPNITAWSVYTTPFNIDYVVVAGDRVFIRSGDDLYLFGGVDGKAYDNCGVEVRLPYHDGGKPGHEKLYSAIDITAQGDWDVSIATNYDNPDAEEEVAHLTPNDPLQPISTSTWNKGRHEMSAYASHLSMRLYNRTNGPAILSNLAIHYALGSDAE